MKIQVHFTKVELKVVHRALSLSLIYSDNEEEVESFGAMLRLVELCENVNELLFPFMQSELRLIARALTFGIIHVDGDEESFEMTKLERNINVLASVPQTM